MNMRKGNMDPQTNYLNKLGYETSDVVIGSLVKWGVALVIFLVLMAAVAMGVYEIFTPHDAPEAEVPALTAGRVLPPAPYPLLQADPRKEMVDFRAEEQARLHSYGWTDKKTGVAHMPIERAIDLTAEQGLPVRSAAKKE